MTTMMSAAVPATALVHPVDSIGVMPRGLTDTDGERIAAALDLICTTIRHVHRMCDLPIPTEALAVHQVRRGLRRTYGSAPRRLARPLSVEEIRQIVDGIDRTTIIGIRDAAMILLGYASALRRSELVTLTLSDIEDKPAGLMLHIRRSKTDPEGHGDIVGVAHGQRAATDPVAALNAWREIRGAAPGPVFTRVWGSTVSLQPLSGHVPARMLRARAEAAGLDGTRITAHSMRAGHATAAALAGVPLDRIAAQTRHKDLSVLVNRYIRPLEALATTSSKDLGLWWPHMGLSLASDNPCQRRYLPTEGRAGCGTERIKVGHGKAATDRCRPDSP